MKPFDIGPNWINGPLEIFPYCYFFSKLVLIGRRQDNTNWRVLSGTDLPYYSPVYCAAVYWDALLGMLEIHHSSWFCDRSTQTK